MKTTTYLLLVLIVLILCVPLVRRNDFIVEAYAHRQDGRAERYEQAKRHFPTVVYNEPDLPDTEENRAKNEKKKRFNELGNWVSSNTRPDIAEMHSSANYFDFPALPVAKSDVIVIGVVSEAEAHLSQTRRMYFRNLRLWWKRY